MIKSVHILNFLSHKDTYLEFDPGVNVFVGSSDHGKSAVIKALKWLIQNRPLGEDFRNWDGGDVEVTMTLEKGVTITRKKTNSENYYKINDGKPLMAGVEVPEEIQKLLNMTDVNLHQQLDLPFLLTESSGSVAKHFNKVARIDKISKTEKAIRSEISRVDSSIEKHKSDIEKFTQELKGFPDLQKIEAELEVLEGLEEKQNKLFKDIQTLNILIRRIDALDDQIEETSQLLIFEKDVDHLLEQIKKRDAAEDEILRLDTLITDIEMIDYKINQFQKKIQHEESITYILTKIEERRVITTDLRALNRLVDTIYHLNEKLERTQKNAVEMEIRFKKEFPNICPLCGTPKKDIKL